MVARITTTFLYVLIALTAFVAASPGAVRPVKLEARETHAVDARAMA